MQLPPRAFLLLAALAMTVPAFAGDAPRPSGPISPNAKPGGILCEYFKGIPGGSVNEFVTKPAFPNTPTESILLTSFEIPTDTDDNYGTAVRGFILPPTTGDYTFWIASDDNSELWLSPSENPKDKIKLCQVSGFCAPREWEKGPEQKSKPIPLTAGRKYYIEALHKEGAGGDNLAVGWQLADGTFERPIPGKRLIPASTPKPPPPVVVQIQGTLPRTPGFHKCMSKVSGAGDTFNFPFLLYIPKDFGQQPVPSLLFLHGVGECGTDLEGVYWNGPSGHIKNDQKLREFMPFLVISPQIAGGWSWTQRRIVKATVGLLDEIQKAYGALMDKDRVTMTGLSLGGAGTWHVALEAPDRFAAIVPSDPRAVRPDEAAEKLKDIAVWVIAGANDGDFAKGAQEMFDALKNSLPKPVLMLVPNCGHGAWSLYYPKRQFYEWLTKWKRGVNVALPPGKMPVEVAAQKPPPEKVAEKPPEKPIAKPVEKPVEKPKEVAVVAPPKKVKPPEPPKPAPPPPAVVKAPEPVAKIVEPPRPPPKVVEATKPVEPPKPVPVVAEVSKPKPSPEPPKLPAPGIKTVAAPPAVVEPAIVIAPKPIDPVPKPAARPATFPYAQTSLFLAALFMSVSLYFLLTTDARPPVRRLARR